MNFKAQILALLMTGCH